jgi:predicted CXXCH cytochrome family protein
MANYLKIPKTKEETQLRKFSVLLIITLVMMMVLSGIALAEIAGNTRGVDVPNQDQYFYLETSNEGLEEGNTNFYLPNYQDPAMYRIHTNYTADTDACASCHSTHTAVGASLLQWYTVYETCMACHDGTVTNTYNVVDGQIGAHNATTSGGLFGQMTQNVNDTSLSNHNASGGLNIYAAYGGRRTPGTEGWADDYGTWNDTFTCASCHTPHGLGGNARILHPDVNGVARQNAKDSDVDTVTWSVYGNEYIEFDDIILTGYPYNTEYTAVFKGAVEVAKSDYRISNASGKGRIYLDDPNAVTRVKYVPSLRVQFKVENYLQANEAVTHVSGVNAFCAACHTDYNAEGQKAGSELTGVYSKAYRHPVEFAYEDFYAPNTVVESLGMKFQKTGDDDIMTCLTCHFAHGTNSDLWGATLTDTSYTGGFAELNRSSALKRLPNMGTCEGCHQKALASEGYWYNTHGDEPLGYPEGGESYGVFTQVGSEYMTYGNYAGSETCKACHGVVYEKWEDTDHTKKATRGPAQNGGQQEEIYDYIWNAWHNAVDGSAAGQWPAQVTMHMIVQRVGNDLYMLKEKTPLPEIDYVVGFRVKQRYAKFWDGTLDAATELLVANTTDNGISWSLTGVETTAGDANLTDVKSRAGYKFHFIEVKPTADGTFSENSAKYGEQRSWQQRCIACHTTGFDAVAWDEALAGYVAGTGSVDDVKEIYVTDLRVGCEACHGPAANHVALPGKKNITNPARLSGADRLNACAQCHTRTEVNIAHAGNQANDLRGYKVGHDMNYYTFATRTRPTWGAQTRRVSADGKGRSGHQQDMDLLMTKALGNTTMGNMSCFTCHDAHSINGQFVATGQGRDRLKTTEAQTCGACHSSMNLNVAMNGRTGTTYGSGIYTGRVYAQQHLFNLNPTKDGPVGFLPTNSDQYTWGQLHNDTWVGIWPWEHELFQAGDTEIAKHYKATVKQAVP